MNMFSFNGAMYVQVEESSILKESIYLGDGTIHPGEYVEKLGENKRTSFEMQDGWYLKYVGRVNDLILFDTNGSGDNRNIYYAFHYINKNLLLITCNSGAYDIRINKLIKHENVKGNVVNEQLTLM